MNRHIEFLSADKKTVKLDIEVRTLDGKRRDWETLEEVENPTELSIMGQVGNRCHGQVHDAFEPTEAQKTLVEFWKKHHLNGMCAGTKAQTEALEGCKSTDYDKQCEYLDFHGLLYDRGYKYGTGWLWRPFPEGELDGIVAAVETESADRTEGRKTIDFGDTNEIERLRELIDERFDTDPDSLIALMMHLNLNEDDLDDIECLSDHNFCFHDDYWYAGTRSDLEDVAMDTIDRDLWAESVAAGYTDMGFAEWREQWIEDDLAGALCSVDGEIHEYDIDGYTYLVCAN